MVNIQSKVNIIDNSGAIKGKCIKIYKKKHLASVGDFLLVSIKSAKPDRKIKKSNLLKSVLVRQNRNLIRSNGSYVRFKENAVVLVNNKNNPIGTRIKGPVCQELRKKKLMKLVSLAPMII